MTPIYARDLDESKRNDAFMGKGFEEALKKAEAEDEDLVIGEFDDSAWKKAKEAENASSYSKREKLAKLLEVAKKLETPTEPTPEREHFIDSDGKKVYIPMDYPEISLEEHNQALVNYYEARDRAKGKIWKVNCKKCSIEMEACDGFEPIYCANCVFEVKCKKCAREECNFLTKDLFCSQICKDMDDSETAQREAEWSADEKNQVKEEWYEHKDIIQGDSI